MLRIKNKECIITYDGETVRVLIRTNRPFQFITYRELYDLISFEIGWNNVDCLSFMRGNGYLETLLDYYVKYKMVGYNATNYSDTEINDIMVSLIDYDGVREWGEVYIG